MGDPLGQPRRDHRFNTELQVAKLSVNFACAVSTCLVDLQKPHEPSFSKDHPIYSQPLYLCLKSFPQPPDPIQDEHQTYRAITCSWEFVIGNQVPQFHF